MVKAEEIVRIIGEDGQQYEGIVCLVCPHPLSDKTATISLVVHEQ